MRATATNVFLAMAVVLLAACGSSDKGGGVGAAGAQKPIAVVAVPVLKKSWSNTIEALGTAKANESVTLTAKVTETVSRVAFKDGDKVETGQVLVSLTGRAETAQLEEMRAAWKEADQQYQRQIGLVEQGTLPRSQLDAQVALRDAAKARMETMRARLSDRVITAPFAGVLGFRRVSEGTLVSPGTEIATLDDVSIIKVDFSVPETELRAVAVGLSIGAKSAAYPDREFVGTVVSIDSRVDPVTRAIVVRATVPNPDSLLKPGMLINVVLASDAHDALVVPEIAVNAIGSRQYVFVAGDDAIAHQTDVKLGIRRTGEVEVLSGLSEGQRVVTDGIVKLRDGSKLALREADAPAATETTAAR